MFDVIQNILIFMLSCSTFYYWDKFSDQKREAGKLFLGLVNCIFKPEIYKGFDNILFWDPLPDFRDFPNRNLNDFEETRHVWTMCAVEMIDRICCLPRGRESSDQVANIMILIDKGSFENIENFIFLHATKRRSYPVWPPKV